MPLCNHLMNIYKTLRIGAFHTNYCEDFWVEENIGNHQKLIAVLDGCTMGTESAFAAMLYGKILRNYAKQAWYEEFHTGISCDEKTQLRNVVEGLIQQVKITKNQLGLETNELLATLIIAVVNTQDSTAEILTIGDGLVCIDGKLVEYAQDDKPDYLGYHLGKAFDEWFKRQNQRLSITQFQDLSISTDGIFTFKNLTNKQQQKTEEEIIHYLLTDKEDSKFENFLDRKVRSIHSEWNHVVTDDLAIIRIIK